MADTLLRYPLLGLLWALLLTIALAILCRFLPGGTGDRMSGVAVRSLPDA
ncbi:MAG: hypothetical protein JNM30_10140 [Rhodospirillales bacterium]|nr:hypothetical protein [Rhodospirillales bacterium]